MTLFDSEDRPRLRVIVEADGGSRGNPGPSGYGAVVLDAHTGDVLAERNDFIGIESNNVAEYGGLIAGLQAALDLGATQVDVRMDSKLVIEQMLGRWQVKAEHLRPLRKKAGELNGQFERTTYTWIPREQNKHADRLANEAMDARASTTSGLVERTNDDTSHPESSAQRPAAMAQAGRTRFILLRHGVTEHTVAKVFAGRSDLPLTDLGREQARRAAERISHIDTVDAIVCSPLQRCRGTAAIVAERFGVGVEVDEGFVEADFGDWDGYSFGQIAAKWPKEMTAWFEREDAAPPGGESYVQIAARVRSARDRVLAKHAGRNVVIVSHVTPIKMMVRFALDAPWQALYRMFLDPASISVIDTYADGPVNLISFNDSAHLPR